jgi:ABC-type multidrug transport system ATPase subunit
VLLDEPTAHLDAPAVASLARLLDSATGLGGSVLLTEQAGWRLAESVASWWLLEEGRLRPTEAPLPPFVPAPGHEPGPESALELHGITVARGGRVLLREVDLALRAGEIVLLSGPNGAGKSTLAEVAAGLRRPQRGAVRTTGHTALMLPGAELQLFAASVAEEVRAPGGNEPGARVLRAHRLEHLAGRAPWTLSRGERQRLVHAVLDLQRPPVMVVDEPAQGLHHQELIELVELIHRRAARGRAYLVISHREELAAACHRHLRVVGGRLEEG